MSFDGDPCGFFLVCFLLGVSAFALVILSLVHYDRVDLKMGYDYP